MTKRERATEILTRLELDTATDFYTLPASTVSALIDEADAVKYRKPKCANGSRARYFLAYLQRLAQRPA